MYPLTILTLLPALASDYRIARYLLPLPVVGACIAVYQILIEQGVVKQTQACLISAPGGCATKWTDTFGYLTIPVLTLTAFVLAFAFLVFACFEAEGSPT
jgi:disulfide bond formation protein DsbB